MANCSERQNRSGLSVFELLHNRLVKDMWMKTPLTYHFLSLSFRSVQNILVIGTETCIRHLAWFWQNYIHLKCDLLVAQYYIPHKDTFVCNWWISGLLISDSKWKQHKCLSRGNFFNYYNRHIVKSMWISFSMYMWKNTRVMCAR